MSHPHSELFQQASEAQRYLESNLPSELQKPRFAIICGSGLGGLADTVDEKNKAEFQYGDIPHFPMSTGTFVRSSFRNTTRARLPNGSPFFFGCLSVYKRRGLLSIVSPCPVFFAMA